MHAIILAAGRGSRLAERNVRGRPKCLMEFDGISLLARHLDLLYRLGILRADLVIGFEADQIVEHVGRLTSRPEIAFHFNPRYEQGSVVSLRAAGDALSAGSDVLLMDADVLYHPDILARLVATSHRNCFLLDRNFEAGEEPVKIAVRGGRMVEFRKQLNCGEQYEEVGESVGFYRFSAPCAIEIAAECARFEAEGFTDAPHEEVLRNLLLRAPDAFAFEDVTGLPWIEIDFPEDVVRARNEILPLIRAALQDA